MEGSVSSAVHGRLIVIGELGNPSGLAWIGESRALVIADSSIHHLLIWREGAGFYLPIPLQGQPSLDWGGVTSSNDSFYVTRPGRGNNGGIVRVPPRGQPGDLPGLDPSRRRIGILGLEDGCLLTTFYVARGSSRGGGVTRISKGREHILVRGLRMPAGLARIETTIYVADHETQTIARFSLVERSPSAQPIASIPYPKYICAGPEKSLIIATHTGQLYWMTPSGSTRLLASELGRPGGVACDRAGGRVFVATLPQPRRRAALFMLPL